MTTGNPICAVCGHHKIYCGCSKFLENILLEKQKDSKMTREREISVLLTAEEARRLNQIYFKREEMNSVIKYISNKVREAASLGKQEAHIYDSRFTDQEILNWSLAQLNDAGYSVQIERNDYIILRWYSNNEK